MKHGLPKAALAAVALLVLIAGARSVEASPISVPIALGAGGSRTFDVDVDTNGLALISFDFSFGLPGDLKVTGAAAGSLLPAGSLAAPNGLFFLSDGLHFPDILAGDDLSVVTSPFDVFGVLAPGFGANGLGTLFSLTFTSSAGVTGSLTFGPSTLDPLAASLVGSGCDLDPHSPECNIEFAARFDTSSQRILVDVAPVAELVPEPATIGLVGLGLAAAAWRRKRSTRARRGN